MITLLIEISSLTSNLLLKTCNDCDRLMKCGQLKQKYRPEFIGEEKVYDLTSDLRFKTGYDGHRLVQCGQLK